MKRARCWWHTLADRGQHGLGVGGRDIDQVPAALRRIVGVVPLHGQSAQGGIPRWRAVVSALLGGMPVIHQHRVLLVGILIALILAGTQR